MQVRRPVQAERTGAALLGEQIAVSDRLRRGIEATLVRVGWATPLAVLIAVAARLPYFRQTDFPLNDGGLFVAMSNDLAANGLVPPSVTSYNAEGIPFAYPPLAFYVNAVLHLILGIDALTLARWLPLVENVLSVIAVAALARAALGRGWSATLAPIIFALLPRSYEWMVMGGGLTRSLGYLLAIACVGQAIHLARTPSAGRMLLCAVLAGLALLSHLEEGLFAVYSAALALLCYGPRVRGALMGIALAVGAAIVSAPWWASVIARHGVAPFVSASLTSGWSTPASLVGAIGEFLAPASVALGLVGALGIIGAVVCTLRGDFFPPLWLLAIFVLTPRSAPSEAVLPLALLSAVAVVTAVVPAVVGAAGATRVARRFGDVLAAFADRSAERRSLAAVGVLGLLAGVYWLSPRLPIDPFSLNSLPTGENATMTWLASNAAPDARFLVLSSTRGWEEDLTGEWFPLLAGRESLLTPQGTEWLPGQLYARKICLFQGVRDVAGWQNGVADLDAWAANRGVSFTDVYISTAVRGPVDWSNMIASARRSPAYTVLVDSPDAVVLHRATPVTPRWTDSGEFSVASDCASLGDQAPDSIAAFEASYGSRAAAEWVAQHEQAIPPRQGFTSLVARAAGSIVRPAAH